MKKLISIALVIFITRVSCSFQTYDGFQVHRITPENEEHRNLLLQLEKENEIDFWTNVRTVGVAVDIMVPLKRREGLISIWKENGMTPEIFLHDVQSIISEQSINDNYSSERVNMTWNKYYNLDDIYSWMDQLASAYSVVEVMEVGITHEKRPMKLLKISFGPGRKAVYVEGGLHAREWISPATTNFLINQLLTTTSPTFKRIAEGFDWYFVPVANPDGYVYTHTNDRLWRKNRSPNVCPGTDGNRNWDIFWGFVGTSTNPCDETYGGTKAFSEPETHFLSNFIRSIGSDLEVFISFHSYGNMLLMPYGHTTDHLDNYNEVLIVGKAAAKALAAKYNTKYDVGNTAETIYKHSGGAMDWVKWNFQPPIAFTYEMRGSQSGGFILPPALIIPNCEEVMDSIEAIFYEGDNIGLITLP